MMSRDWKTVQRKVAQLLSPSQQTKGARPALSSDKRGMLECAFEVVGLPNADQSQAQIISAVLDYMNRAGKPVSRSTVQKRYRQWLDARRYPKKRYASDRDLKF